MPNMIHMNPARKEQNTLIIPGGKNWCDERDSY
jgi:hypothetical protein